MSVLAILLSAIAAIIIGAVLMAVIEFVRSLRKARRRANAILTRWRPL